MLQLIAQTFNDEFTTTTTTTDAETAAMAGAIMIAVWIFALIISIPIIIGMWKMFEKAGKPGWAAIVPVYNIWVMAEVAGKPGWWGLLASLGGLIPFVGFIISLVFSVLITIGIAKNFGKDNAGFILVLLFFPYIGYPMLGFGQAQYLGSGGGATPMAPTPPAPTPPTQTPAAPMPPTPPQQPLA